MDWDRARGVLLATGVALIGLIALTAFFRDVDQAFRQRSAFFVFPDVIPALDAMQASGLRLAVVSNWGWHAPELLQTLELARHFEVMSISARVGYQKPHADSLCAMGANHICMSEFWARRSESANNYIHQLAAHQTGAATIGHDRDARIGAGTDDRRDLFGAAGCHDEPLPRPAPTRFGNIGRSVLLE